MWWRRLALYLCGMKAGSGAAKQTVPYAIPHIPATRWDECSTSRKVSPTAEARQFRLQNFQTSGYTAVALPRVSPHSPQSSNPISIGWHLPSGNRL
jgi:hypothetical protein